MSLVPVLDDVVPAAFSYPLHQILHSKIGVFTKPSIASAESNVLFCLPSPSAAGPAT